MSQKIEILMYISAHSSLLLIILLNNYLFINSCHLLADSYRVYCNLEMRHRAGYKWTVCMLADCQSIHPKYYEIIKNEWLLTKLELHWIANKNWLT